MSEDYKHKYEDLMKRCEEFNIWFEDHKRKSNHLTPVVYPTTAPWPPIGLQYTYNSICETCKLSMTNKSNYVCNIPGCPRNFTVTCSTITSLADNNMSMLKPETSKTLTITQLNNLKKEEET